MKTRIALLGIIVEQKDAVEQLNRLLHEYGDHIIGRMGVPYQEKGVNIISVAMDAPQDVINALSGKIGETAWNHSEDNLFQCVSLRGTLL